MAIALVEHQAGSFALEFWDKCTTLLGHQTPLYGEHSRLNGCPVSLDLDIQNLGNQGRFIGLRYLFLTGVNIVRVAFLDTLGDRLGVVVLHLKIPSRKMALCYPVSLVLGFA